MYSIFCVQLIPQILPQSKQMATTMVAEELLREAADAPRWTKPTKNN